MESSIPWRSKSLPEAGSQGLQIEYEEAAEDETDQTGRMRIVDPLRSRADIFVLAEPKLTGSVSPFSWKIRAIASLLTSRSL
jgi:hypothetical protein